jgi:hypothetical protein
MRGDLGCRAFLLSESGIAIANSPSHTSLFWRAGQLRIITFSVFLCLCLGSVVNGQSSTTELAAREIIQPSQSLSAAANSNQTRELVVPSATMLEVEAAYTVNSLDLKPGERISFRVLIPIVIDGTTVIEKGALVTARIIKSKRGGHWGVGGKLVWSMEDVVAVDNTRVPLAPETASRAVKPANATTNAVGNMKQGRVNGTSHTGQVAAMSIISGALFPPLALLHGFKRGENAILREGRRFIVMTNKDTAIKVAITPG